ncbi:thiamine pyrophosphokinase [Microdochium trichocladiopsis]|uniref:Thiamine pyrophosphokinase n=1 Tax=Microdochium trichocladiopsis TaxID=1682393 RepID=A0A9P8YDJ1_9PEZI|nr:thiamine pyrophosphokinase [Microdochium trichocladiopsis]KAH7035930.1 thiamine pyrophosphokinase [Microdochium trichocladiopsis]
MTHPANTEQGGSSSSLVEWHLPRVVRPSAYSTYDYALVILNQPVGNEPLFDELWSGASERVAADGGANRVLQLSKRKEKQQQQQQTPSSSSGGWYRDLDTIIGDLDSLTDEARSFFSSPLPATVQTSTDRNDDTQHRPSRTCDIIHDPDQYSTDFTKAVRHVRAKAQSSRSTSHNGVGGDSDSSSKLPPPSLPPRDIICLGGLGGRVDQGLSQLHHLYLFQQDAGSYEREGRIFLLSEEGLTFLLQGGKTHRIHVRASSSSSSSSSEADKKASAFAKHVGILPIREPSVISTRGLEWDVQDWKTEFGGQVSTSNHVVADVVEVWTTRDVLFTIALKRDDGYDD